MAIRKKLPGFVPRTTFDTQMEADHNDGVFEELRARTARAAEEAAKSPNGVLLTKIDSTRFVWTCAKSRRNKAGLYHEGHLKVACGGTLKRPQNSGGGGPQGRCVRGVAGKDSQGGGGGGGGHAQSGRGQGGRRDSAPNPSVNLLHIHTCIYIYICIYKKKYIYIYIYMSIYILIDR